MAEQEKQDKEQSEDSNEPYDYSYVPTVARVAVYDDMKMAPRVIEIEPAPTADYIEKLADVIDEQKRRLGGKIPYSAIREVSENFIHARFTEVVVSIFDHGNTIRFCDQGPGIKDKDKATLPGFTSAIEPMKHYIRGVGSGLPLVKEYLDLSHGKITIEDNLNTGAVVTISLEEHPATESIVPGEPANMSTIGDAPQTAQGSNANATAPYAARPSIASYQPQPTSAEHQAPYQAARPYAPQPSLTFEQAPSAPQPQPYNLPQQGFAAIPPQQGFAAAPQQRNVPLPPLDDREITALTIFAHEGALGVTELSRIAELPQSSTYKLMEKLQENGLIERTSNKKRILTDYGAAVCRQLDL